MPVKPERLSYFVEFDPEAANKADRLKGIDFHQLFEQLRQKNIRHIQITIEQVIDWDIAPMRKYFHAAVVPAFTEKFSETTKNPYGGPFRPDDIKQFLKAKFLGFVKDENYNKWKSSLPFLSGQIPGINEWFRCDQVLKGIKEPIEIAHTAKLSAEQYHKFIDDCEKYYFELFNEMFDCREKPVEKEN
jgi:hypothetical protein